jgi:hypothetical protein
MSIYEETSKIRLKEQATEAINWIADELDKIKGDSMYQWQKKDNIAKVREAIRKLI